MMQAVRVCDWGHHANAAGLQTAGKLCCLLLCRGAHKDRIEVKRVGSQPSRVTITFEQDFVPPAYKVDPRLAEVRSCYMGRAAVADRSLHASLATCFQVVMSQRSCSAHASAML